MSSDIQKEMQQVSFYSLTRLGVVVCWRITHSLTQRLPRAVCVHVCVYIGVLMAR